MLKKIIAWAVSTVILPFIPLMVTYIILLLKGIPITLPVLFKNGELLLISLLITGTGVGAAIITDNRSKFKYIAGSICFIMVFFIAILYGFVFSNVISNQNLNIEILFNLSKWIFLSSAIVGASCILIPEK